MNERNGILIVDKPRDWTSHDVVKKTRNMLGGIKVGHTGTLDPLATGVMVLLIGSATKSASCFENDDKRYNAEVTFGTATDSYDSMGSVTATGDPLSVDMDQLKKAVDSFRGNIEQVPPMFSALKVGGRKLYELARKGKTIDRKARLITIHDIRGDYSGYPTIHLDIQCSKGTYVRSIAHELGEIVGCPSHLSALIRTASGKYTLDDAIDFSRCVSEGNGNDLAEHIRPIESGVE